MNARGSETRLRVLPAPGSRGAVLVCDDEEPIRRAFARTLERAGFLVRLAATGAQALALSRLSSHRLFVLDVVLPDLDGRHIARLLRADPTTSSTPIIFVSGTPPTADDGPQGARHGAARYLVKPIHADELVAHVEAVLRAAPEPA